MTKLVMYYSAIVLLAVVHARLPCQAMSTWVALLNRKSSQSHSYN